MRPIPADFSAAFLFPRTLAKADAFQRSVTAVGMLAHLSLGRRAAVQLPWAPSRPAAWSPPEALVAPSSFTGVHGLAIDKKGRLLAGSVVGNAIWEVDRQTGAARV